MLMPILSNGTETVQKLERLLAQWSFQIGNLWQLFCHMQSPSVFKILYEGIKSHKEELYCLQTSTDLRKVAKTC